MTLPASEIAPEILKWPVPATPPSVTSWLFKVSVDRTVISPLAGSGIVLLTELCDEPPHDAARTPNDPGQQRDTSRPARSPHSQSSHRDPLTYSRTNPHRRQSSTPRRRGSCPTKLGRAVSLRAPVPQSASPPKHRPRTSTRKWGQTPSSATTAQAGARTPPPCRGPADPTTLPILNSPLARAIRRLNAEFFTKAGAHARLTRRHPSLLLRAVERAKRQ